jgi:hypothetical protein
MSGLDHRGRTPPFRRIQRESLPINWTEQFVYFNITHALVVFLLVSRHGCSLVHPVSMFPSKLSYPVLTRDLAAFVAPQILKVGFQAGTCMGQNEGRQRLGLGRALSYRSLEDGGGQRGTAGTLREIFKKEPLWRSWYQLEPMSDSDNPETAFGRGKEQEVAISGRK